MVKNLRSLLWCESKNAITLIRVNEMLFAALIDMKQTSKIMEGEVRPEKGERFDAFEFHGFEVTGGQLKCQNNGQRCLCGFKELGWTLRSN